MKPYILNIKVHAKAMQYLIVNLYHYYLYIYLGIQNQIPEEVSSQTALSVEEAADRAGLRLDILSKEYSVKPIDLARFCMNWNLIGKHLGLTEADLTAVDGDNRTVEEKRVGILEKWKSKFAFKATYRAFIEALLAEGRCEDAIGACKVIKAAEG